MFSRTRIAQVSSSAELSSAIKSNGGEVQGVFYVQEVYERDESMGVVSDELVPVDGRYRIFEDTQIPDNAFVFQGTDPEIYPSTLIFNEETILEGLVAVASKR